MTITVPVPGLGDVTVLTAAGDLYEVSCGQPVGATYYQIPTGTIFFLQCNIFNSAIIAYLADLGDNIIITDVISRLLQAKIITYQAKVKTNVFEPYIP